MSKKIGESGKRGSTERNMERNEERNEETVIIIGG